MLSDRLPRAYQALQSALPGLSLPVQQIILAIGWFESGYGVIPEFSCSSAHPCCPGPAWPIHGNPCPNNTLADGTPSNNWGAVIAVGSQSYISHPDKDKNGNPVQSRFALLDTPEQGVLNFWKTWAKGDTLAAAQRGNAYETAKARYRHGYFGGTVGTDEDRIRIYARAIQDVSGQVARLLGQSHQVRLGFVPGQSTASSSGPSLFTAALIVGGMYLYLKRPGPLKDVRFPWEGKTSKGKPALA